MHVESVGHLAGGAADERVHARDPDRDPRMVARAAAEHRVHEREAVEAPLVGRLGAGLEVLPNRLEAAHVVDEPRDRRVVGHGIAALHVGAYLRAEPEMETSSAQLLQIPGGLRHRHRAARERDRDVRAERQPFGRLRGESDRQEGIVSRLEGPGAVEPHSFVAPRLVVGGGKASVTELRV